PTDLLPAPYQRVTPHLYSPTEIAALVHAAGILAVPMQAATYQALISLLAVTCGWVRPSDWTGARST
ncbi:MAG TPA: hypothetical protein VK784_08255, partial [Pseudonocardiaceae bacterium]|nr:hypothetical protein [Pseudonocardiaceae bacterium]